MDFTEALNYCLANREYDKHTFPGLERMEGSINGSPAIRLAIPNDQNCVGFLNDLQIPSQEDFCLWREATVLTVSTQEI